MLPERLQFSAMADIQDGRQHAKLKINPNLGPLVFVASLIFQWQGHGNNFGAAFLFAALLQ